MSDINEMLDEEIQEVLTALSGQEVGTEKYNNILLHLNSLYRLRTEGKKAEKEIEKVELEKKKLDIEKLKVNVNAEIEREKLKNNASIESEKVKTNAEIEREKMQNNNNVEANRIDIEKQKLEADERKAKRDRFVTGMLKAAEIGSGVVIFTGQMWMFFNGLHFETTGAIGSSFVRSLVNVVTRPKK